MKISVFTVTYNSAKTVADTLDSFFAQDYSQKELVIVDGNSKDETLNIIASYPQESIRLITEPDRGMYDALNKALRIYTGNAFGVLNSDDTYHDSTVISRIAGKLHENDIVHGHLNFVDDHQSKKIVRRWRAKPRPRKGFTTGWMPAHPTFYVHRAVADAVGDFDLSLTTAADYDWMLRAIETHGFYSVVLDHVMIDMLKGGKSTKSLLGHVGHNLESLRSRRRWLGAGLVDYALIAKPARKLGQFFRTSVA